MWTLDLITPPAVEALDCSPDGEVYQHLRLEPALTPQDELLATYAAAARHEGERISRRQFITATWELSVSSWNEPGLSNRGGLDLPLPPLQSVVSVKYLDSAGNEQTLDPAAYIVTAPSGDFAQRGNIRPAAGFSFPGGYGWGGSWQGETYPWTGASTPRIKVRFVAGYGDAPSDVPALFRAAMLLLVGEAYESREMQSVGTSAVRNPRAPSTIFFDNRAW